LNTPHFKVQRSVSLHDVRGPLAGGFRTGPDALSRRFRLEKLQIRGDNVSSGVDGES
jgi:hypothetical protein